jgi:DNA-binding NarL/FixJ family response regulator
MKLRILIVDDSLHFLAAARQLFEQQGIEVAGVASTTRQALRSHILLRPDVTLIDIDLGDESGIDLARRLTEQATGEQVRIILISVHSELDVADLVRDSPAIGFLQKTHLSGRAVMQLLDSTGDSSSNREV